MSRHVILAAALPAPPEKLYEMYLNAGAHSAFTGSPVTIEPRVGAAFSAFGGILSGKILHLESNRMIVQTWRSGNWPKDAVDSVLVLTFVPEKTGARIELVQINVPDEDFADICHGWEKYYWTPWRAFLTNSSKTS